MDHGIEVPDFKKTFIAETNNVFPCDDAGVQIYNITKKNNMMIEDKIKKNKTVLEITERNNRRITQRSDRGS